MYNLKKLLRKLQAFSPFFLSTVNYIAFWTFDNAFWTTKKNTSRLAMFILVTYMKQDYV